MIRGALILSAGLVAALCFACVPPPGPSALRPAKFVAGIVCPVSDFLGKVSYLTTPFTPTIGAQLPAGSALPVPGPGTPAYATDLTNAFNAASPDFKQTLCSLDAIYINAVSCANSADCFGNSWGWYQSQPTAPNGRVIAISAGLWSEANYSRYESDLTQSILPSSGVIYSNASSCVAGVCQPVDNLTMALLAALAHEAGHIGWYVEVPVGAPANFCGGRFFTSWDPRSVTSPPPWRDLLTLNERNHVRRHTGGGWPHVHSKPPQIDNVDRPGAGDANKFVYDLVATANPPPPTENGWASLLAAMSPDEDFVETYELKVLTTATPPLLSATISVPHFGTADIVAGYLKGWKPSLKTKADCISVAF